MAQSGYYEAAERCEGATALVQIALLLSRWSPYDKSTRVNNYWVDQAFHHAMVARLSESGAPYSRVIWWCCIVKNRGLALGLRRPDTLRVYEPGPMLQWEDCGAMARLALMPQLYSPQVYSKICVIEAFIALCGLSELMKDIVLLRSRWGQYADWRTTHTRSAMYKADVMHVLHIEQGFRQWRQSHNNLFAQMGKPSLNRVASTILRVLLIVYL